MSDAPSDESDGTASDDRFMWGDDDITFVGEELEESTPTPASD